MNAMERLVATAKGEPCDRIPVFCDLLDQGARELGLSSLQEYYANGEYVAEGQLKLREKYGHDNLWALFYVGREAEMLGCRRMIYAAEGPPNVGEMVIRSQEDIYKLEIPIDFQSIPAFREPLKCLQILKKEAGGKYPVCAYVTSSMTLPALLMGMENWMKLLLTGPAEVRDVLLEKCSLFFQREIAAYRIAGADVLVYSNPFGSTDFLPMKLIEKMALPWMEHDLLPGGLDGVAYYCGGAKLNSVIDIVWNRLPFGSFIPSSMDDIVETKRIVSGRAMCGGIINNIKFLDWDREQMRNEVKRILAGGMPGGKFFLGVLALPLNTSEDIIRAYIEAAFEFGNSGMDSNYAS